MNRLALYLLVLIIFIRCIFVNYQESPYRVDLSPVRVPARRTEKILILIVLNSETSREEYAFPLNTVRCYAQKHNYSLAIVEDAHYGLECRQKDYMFRRHCISATLLAQSPTTQWLLFLDADIAVANPDRLIEEYLDPHADLIMYDRFISWEIAMGSYLARNSPWTRDFLKKFANYEQELPESFHGTDNGAIHTFILQNLQPTSYEKAKLCLDIWKSSSGFDELFLFEACARSVMGGQMLVGKLKIIPKGRGWVRDGWISQSKWSPDRDFMLHGYKSSDRHYRTGLQLIDKVREWVSVRFKWYSFLSEDVQPPVCTWLYDKGLILTSEELDQILLPLHQLIQKRYWRSLALLSARI